MAEAFGDGAAEGEGRLVLGRVAGEEGDGIVAEEEEVPVQLLDGRDRPVSDLRTHHAEINVPPYQFLVSASLLWNWQRRKIKALPTLIETRTHSNR